MTMSEISYDQKGPKFPLMKDLLEGENERFKTTKLNDRAGKSNHLVR